MIDGTMDCKSVTSEEYEEELREVFRFMAGIVATHSKEIAVSIVERFVSVVNLSGPEYRDYRTPLRLAFLFIDECKLFSETMFTKLAHSFGKGLDRVELGYDPRSFVLESLSTLCLALRVNTSLTSLHLRENFIGDKEASSLSEALRVNTSVTYLNLGWNSIGVEGASSHSEALRVNTSLTSLDLGLNSIGVEGASSLSEALRVNTSLTSLDLSQNSIRAEGASSLSEALRGNISLTSLHLSSNSIRAEGCLLYTSPSPRDA